MHYLSTKPGMLYDHNRHATWQYVPRRPDTCFLNVLRSTNTCCMFTEAITCRSKAMTCPCGMHVPRSWNSGACMQIAKTDGRQLLRRAGEPGCGVLGRAGQLQRPGQLEKLRHSMLSLQCIAPAKSSIPARQRQEVIGRQGVHSML